MNFLEKTLANSILGADPILLQRMVERDENLIEWAFQKWSWLENTCKIYKITNPKLVKQVQKVSAKRIYELVGKQRPDLVTLIKPEWLQKQIEYAQWLVANKL